jgi:Tol biopolymer transport system component
MSPTRRQQVEDILVSALSLEGAARAAYLDAACGADIDVRREVESLLARERDADEFLRTPPPEAAVQALASEQSGALGSMLGPYRIDSLLGSGGMGDVYLAHDPRLDRDVAIKVLPEPLARDEMARERLRREGLAGAALDHPFICKIYEIGEDNGHVFCVMEYIRGETLSDQMRTGRLPLSESLRIAGEIAEAVEAAHASGFLHRDLKPANIMVTSTGHVKVMDFGLAKKFQSDQLTTTLTEQAASLTARGAVIGTIAYMSPEQAAGKALDARSDIFSFGVLLYEMLAGQRPFRGATGIEVLHEIIKGAADPLPPEFPAGLRMIVEKALEKALSDRYQSMREVVIDLRRMARQKAEVAPAPASSPAEAGPAEQPVRRYLWIGVAALLLALPAVWWAAHRTDANAETTPAADISIVPFTTNGGYNGEATISPDGQTVAYVSDRTGHFDIFLRQIGTTSDIPLTIGQGDNIQPAYSRDGRQIAFVSSRAGNSAIYYPGFDYPLMGGDIWVMTALGGTARRVAKDGNYPSWSPDGSKIVFVRHRGLLVEVPASGGEAREIKVSGNPSVYYPAYSSDARWIFFESQGAGIQAVQATGGQPQQIASGRHPVWDDASQAVIYSDDREGKNHSLYSVPFSLKEGKLGHARALTVGRGRDWQPAVSRDGKLIAYTAIQISFNLETVPFDAESGRVLGAPRDLTTGNQVSYFMRFSPDGRSVAFQSSRGAGQHIWRLDIGSAPVQLTADPKFVESFPHWSPDGHTISFIRHPVQSPNSKSLWLMDADGANPRKILDDSQFARWLPDGSGILYNDSKRDLLIYEFRTGQSREISVLPDSNITMPMLSPDGNWIAYQYATGANHNVDVHRVDLHGEQPRVVVSTPHQDFHPFFSPSGRWIYFQPDHKNLYRVPGPAQDWRQADPVKITDFAESGLYLEDPQVSADGKQFLYARGRITGDIWILRRGK